MTNNFLLYTNDQGDIKVDVLLKDETIWLTINQMAELFGIDKSGISSISKTSLRRENFKRIWLLQILRQPLDMEQ